MLIEECPGQAQSRRCFKLVLFHSLREDVLNLLLGHRVYFDFEIFSQAESLNLKVLSCADEVVDFTDGAQGDFLSSLLG